MFDTDRVHFRVAMRDGLSAWRNFHAAPHQAEDWGDCCGDVNHNTKKLYIF